MISIMIHLPDNFGTTLNAETIARRQVRAALMVKARRDLWQLVKTHVRKKPRRFKGGA